LLGQYQELDWFKLLKSLLSLFEPRSVEPLEPRSMENRQRRLGTPSVSNHLRESMSFSE
jgi:hypothetical protein